MKLVLVLTLILPILARGQWELLAPLPEAASGFAVGCLKGKIIVAGGTNWVQGTKRWLNTIWVYDPVANKWSAGPKLPNTIAYAAYAHDLHGLVIAGGADGKQGRKEVWEMDEALVVKKIGELHEPVVFGSGVLRAIPFDSALWSTGSMQIFGGSPDPDDWSKMGTDLVTIDRSSGKVANGTGLLLDHGLGLAATVALHDRLLSFTGAWFDAQQQVHNTASAYVLVRDGWSPLERYPVAARGVAAVALDDEHVYLAGGYGTAEQGFLTQAYLYDVKADSYRSAVPLPFAATTCLVKCDEHVYVIGGEDRKKHRTALVYRCLADRLLNK